MLNGVGLISARYQKRLGWARAALVMQGLDDESVNHALQILTKPVELDVKEEQSQEPMKSQDDSVGGSLDDVSCEADLNMDQTDSAVPQRQGNPLHDPLAELCPQEPERLDQLSKPSVKCRRHDDWIAHCGCRPDESQLSSEQIVSSAEPSESCEYVLVEVSEDDDDDRNSTEGSFSVVNKTRFAQE